MPGPYSGSAGHGSGSGNGSLNNSRFLQYKPTEIYVQPKKTDSFGGFLAGAAATMITIGVAGTIANEMEKRERAKKNFFQKLLD